MVSSPTPSGRRVAGTPDAGDRVTEPRSAEVLDSRRARRLAASDSSTGDRPTSDSPTGDSSTGDNAVNDSAQPRTRAEAKAARSVLVAPYRAGSSSSGSSSADSGSADAPSLVPRSRAEAKGRRPAAVSVSTVPASVTVTTELTVQPTRASRKAGTTAATGAATGSIDLGVVRSHDEVTHGRRAAPPQGVRRRAELRFGRMVSNPRAWGGALAILLVLIVPGASILSPPTAAVVADEGMITGNDTLPQFPAADPAKTDPASTDPASTDPNTAQPTDAETAAATAAAKAKARAKAKATAAATTTTRRTTPAASRSAARTGGGTPLGITGARSGLPYASGLYMNGSSQANTAAFGNWRGRAVDVVVDWPQRTTWSDIENPDWLIKAWQGTPYTKVWGVAPIPEDGSSSLAQCATGADNSHWRTFAQNMKNSGYSNQIVIRLGWEFNGNWYKWSANNPADFAGCWRQIVGTVSAIAPDLRWDWNVNRGPGSSVKDAADAYPGDAYVDIIGVDNYDQYPGVKSEADWQAQYSGPFGLKHWVDFAKAHGKPFSVPEWGLYPTRGSNSGGDNPLYMKKMLEFFVANASTLAYEAYFNCAESYVQASIFGTVQNPKAAAEYKSILSG